jgi:hypothetical protein
MAAVLGAFFAVAVTAIDAGAVSRSCQTSSDACTAALVELLANNYDEGSKNVERRCGEKSPDSACDLWGHVLSLRGHFADAERVLSKACDSGERGSCLSLAGLMFRHHEPERSYSLLERACDLGSAKTCWDLAKATGEARTSPHLPKLSLYPVEPSTPSLAGPPRSHPPNHLAVFPTTLSVVGRGWSGRRHRACGRVCRS